jgi:hypothetical protein
MSLKVLHLPTATGGNAQGLSLGERQFGVDSQTLITHSVPMGWRAEIELGLESCRTQIGKFYRLLRCFLAIRDQYDIFHFNYGSSLFHGRFRSLPFLNRQLDLPFYPKSARLFATYNGCDARQKYPTMERRKVAMCFDHDCYGGMCNSGKLDDFRRSSIEKMARHVEHMWAVNPDLLHFLPAEKSSFLPYSVSNWSDRLYPPRLDRKLVVVHAPTNRVAKGSHFIIPVLERLQNRYPDRIEVHLVEGKSHEEALKIYRRADLVIDQLLSGWYGAFAVETMAMGKPVLCRIEEEDLRFIPPAMASDLKDAVIDAGPFQLEEALEGCLDSPFDLLERGRRCRDYAVKWHHPAYVASLTVAKYQAAATIV